MTNIMFDAELLCTSGNYYQMPAPVLGIPPNKCCIKAILTGQCT